MTDTQLYLAIGVPILFNATIFGILMSYIKSVENGLNARISSVETGVNARFSSVESRLSSLEGRMMNLENTFTTRFDLLMAG